MTARDDGGPAFARPVSTARGDKTVPGQSGMSLRDWFAGQALCGYAAAGVIDYLSKRHSLSTNEAEALVAKAAYRIADAMLAERLAKREA